MKNFLRVITIVAVANIGLAGTQPPKTAPDLPTSPSFQMVDVIVQFKTIPTSAGWSTIYSAGYVNTSFVHINAVRMQLPSAFIPLIANLPMVAYVSPNRRTKGTLDIATATLNANVAWNLGYNGTGIGVAVIDSGIYTHDDLKTASGTGSRVVYSQSFISGLDASDQYGHGTHVAGIIGSNGHDSTGAGFTRTLKGVAPNVNLINLRALDANGAGTDAEVIAAIDQAIALKGVYNIRVINLSVGRPAWESYTLDPLCQAAEAAWKAGIVVVAAAGNFGRDNSVDEHGYGTVVAPGNDPYVITVGAMNTMGTNSRSDDVLASYSSKGPTGFDHIVKPDLVAPGNGIVSLLAPNSTLAMNNSSLRVPNSYYQSGGTGTSSAYLRLSGTSMATPMVSGAAALLLQQYPSLTPDQVKARLMKTAQKSLPLHGTAYDAFTKAAFSLQFDIFAVGSGYLDIGAAISNTDLTTLPALSPVAVYNSTTHIVTIQRNFTSSWGSAAAWSDSVVFGINVFNGTNNGFSALWGNNAIWGMDDGGDGFGVVWGDSVILGLTMQALDVGDGDFGVVWGDRPSQFLT